MRQDWCILIVKSGFEQIIRDELLSKSSDLFIKDIVLSFDFPGYLFIKTKSKDNRVHEFLAIENTIKILGKGTCIINGRRMSQPQMFSRIEIEKLKIIKKEEQIKPTSFKIGDDVIIKKGDLADIQGKIVELKKRIVKIKPTLLHKIIKVNVQDIEKIGDDL